MFSLVSGMWKMCTTKIQYQVLIIGLDGAGKTTVLEQMRHMYTGADMPSRVAPTVGLNIAKMEVNHANVVFWDLGGQVALRVLWDKYFTQANAILFVIDAADEKRIEEARTELNKLMTNDEVTDAPILIFLNKHDSKDYIAPARVMELLQLDLNTNRPMHLEVVSGLEGKGIQNGMIWLLKTLPFCDRTSRLGLQFVSGG